ncbi:MAG: M48 family metallopeptidase [bacterium]|nr:M48 family metallopeptidase [bacterium]
MSCLINTARYCSKLHRFHACLIVGLIFLLLGVGCSHNQATDGVQFNVVSEYEEIQIGEAGHKQILQQYGVYKNPAISKMVDDMGQRIVKESGRSTIQYTFTVLDSSMINAFALPGGFVYVTRGVLAQLNSQAELAFVIGHEISHVAARHGAQRLSQARAYMTASVVASIFAPEAAQTWGDLVGTSVQLAVLGHGRKHEFEADKLGAEYALAAHYDPREYSSFFKTLKKQERHTPDLLSGLAASHPPTSERIERVEDQLAPEIASIEAGENKNPGILGRDTYLKQIEGLLMGEHGMTGALKSGQYSNYPKGISFKLPKDMTLFVAKPEDKLLEFVAVNGSYEGRLSVIQPHDRLQMSELELRMPVPGEGKKIRTAKLNYYSMPAVQTVYQVRPLKQGAVMHVYTAFLAHHRGYIFEFWAKEPYYDAMLKKMDSLFEGLRFYNDEAIAKSGVYYLKLHAVKPSDTADSIVAKYAIKGKDPVQQLVDFNGVNDDSDLLQRDLIKIP